MQTRARAHSLPGTYLCDSWLFFKCKEVVPEHTWLCGWMGVLTECRYRKVGLYYEPDVTEARYFVVFLIHKAKPPVSSPVL